MQDFGQTQLRWSPCARLFATIAVAVITTTLPPHDDAIGAPADPRSLPASIGLGSADRPTTERGLGCGVLVFNADTSYENGYAWPYGGVVPPSYGAFSEGYESVVGTICSIVLDFSANGTQTDQLMDVYVWEGELGLPGAVVAVSTNVDPGPVALWPAVSRHVVPIATPSVSGDLWVGYWGNWPNEIQGWFVTADLDGPAAGASITHIAPGIGYPTGWHNVSVVWGPTRALGLGYELSGSDAGACCSADGSCTIRREVDCDGTFLGSGIPCVPNSCEQPPDGACCFGDGSCRFVDAFECDNLTGSYLGDGIDCDPNPCPPAPSGACCFIDGTCLVVNSFECSDMGGVYQGPGEVCDPNPCPPPDQGACCLIAEEDCENLFDFECEARGGNFLGDGTDCSVDACPIPCESPFSPPSAPALAGGGGRGPNAGGTLILHYDFISYTTDQSDYCGASSLSDCSAARTRVDDEMPVTFHVFAAFPGPSRLAGLTFGISYQDCFILTGNGDCGNFELSDPTWPASGTGTAVTFATVQESQLVEVYWFAGYVDGGQSTSFALAPHPTQGGNFADDDVPSNIDPIAGYGILGFHQNGLAPCPGSDSQPGACCFPDGSCVVLFESDCTAQGGTFQGEGTTCDSTGCSGLPTGACCLSEGDCIELTYEECESIAGIYLGDDVPCTAEICASTPVRDASWGEIKTMYR